MSKMPRKYRNCQFKIKLEHFSRHPLVERRISRFFISFRMTGIDSRRSLSVGGIPASAGMTEGAGMTEENCLEVRRDFWYN